MNEISNQHNDLIDLPLRKFNASEVDILLVLCYKCQEQGSNEVVLTFEQIKKLSHFKGKYKKELIEAIDNTNKKLIQLNFRIGTETKFTRFVLFPTFEIDGDAETLTVQVHEKFAYLLNNLTENYTSLELQESASLRSAYAKAIYKKLRRFKSTGLWRITIEDFKDYLDIPKSYKIGDIPLKIINPSIDELSPYFKGLKYTPYYKKNSSGRGRPSVAGYEFTFKAEVKETQQPRLLTQEEIAKRTEWNKTPRFCPRCKRPIYSKLQENENGTYTMYGHADWKTGECSFTTFEYSELLEEYKVVEAETVAEVETTEQAENKKRLSDLFSGLFKQ